MSQKYPSVKINVTQDEKDKLEKLAQQQHMSTSAFVKSQLSSLLQENNEASVPYEYEADCRDHVLKVPVSSKEYGTIKAKAGAKTIAAYVRDAALNGSKVIKVEVYDDDISELIGNIQPRLDRIYGVIDALRHQNQLHDTQYARLEGLLNDISKDIRGTVSLVRKNRNSIRQTRLRELRKRCDNAIRTETDSLASFDADTNYYD